jgi:predicted metalloprotease with PDZ domain
MPRPGADDPDAVFVNWSVENGSLHPAGIVNGDLIHAVDGEATPSMKVLDTIIARHKVGDVVRVDVTQRGQRRIVSVTLRGLPRFRLVTYEAAGMPVTDEVPEFRRFVAGIEGGDGARDGDSVSVTSA